MQEKGEQSHRTTRLLPDFPLLRAEEKKIRVVISQSFLQGQKRGLFFRDSLPDIGRQYCQRHKIDIFSLSERMCERYASIFNLAILLRIFSRGRHVPHVPSFAAVIE